jgi:2-dehydropantoate 2-reductase
VTDDIRSAKWMKLVVNAAELIPSSIVNLSLCDAARAPGMLEVMRQAGYEAMEAALADGAAIMPIIGMPPVMSNHPERYVDQILETVLESFSMPDTLATSLQDWRKGRRSEVREINGHVVDVLKAHGKSAPVNERMVELALAIEMGALAPQPSNASILTKSAVANS